MSRYRVGRRRSSLILKEEILHGLQTDEKDHVAIGWVNSPKGHYRRQTRKNFKRQTRNKYKKTTHKWSKKQVHPTAKKDESQFWWKNKQNDNNSNQNSTNTDTQQSSTQVSNATTKVLAAVKEEETPPQPDIIETKTEEVITDDTTDVATVATDVTENNEDNSQLGVYALSGFVENNEQSGKLKILNSLLVSANNDNKNNKCLIVVSNLERLKYEGKKDVNGLMALKNGNYLCTIDSLSNNFKTYKNTTENNSLLLEINKLIASKEVNSVVLDVPEMIEPLQIAEMFDSVGMQEDEHEDEEDANEEESVLERLNGCVEFLAGFSELYEIISVLNVNEFHSNLNSALTYSQAFGANKNIKDSADSKENDSKEESSTIDEQGGINVSDLLMAQIQHSSVIIVNNNDNNSNDSNENDSKTGNSEETSNDILHICTILNNNARIVVTSNILNEIDAIFGNKEVNKYDFDTYEQSMSYDNLLSNIANFKDKYKSWEHNISIFKYESRKPFDPWKLYLLIKSQMLKNIAFADGKLWIATQNDTCFEWKQCGLIITFEESNQPWMTVANPKKTKLIKTKLNDNDKKYTKKYKDLFVGKYDDRRQDIIFIGFKNKDKDNGLNAIELENQLETCLISDSDFKYKTSEEWMEMKDPFELAFDSDESEDGSDEEEESDISDID